MKLPKPIANGVTISLLERYVWYDWAMFGLRLMSMVNQAHLFLVVSCDPYPMENDRITSGAAEAESLLEMDGIICKSSEPIEGQHTAYVRSRGRAYLSLPSKRGRIKLTIFIILLFLITTPNN